MVSSQQKLTTQEKQESVSSRDSAFRAQMPVTVGIALALMFIGWMAATLGHTPLMYDGGSYVVSILNYERPNPLYFRYALALVHGPTIWAAQLTQQVWPAVLVYCLMFSSGPFLASLLSWRLVRDSKPALFVWAMIGIALTGIFAQPYRMGENLYACELAWPLLLGVLVPITASRAVWFVALGLLLASMHPMAVSLLGGIAVTACLRAFVQFKTDPVGSKREALILLRVASALLLIAAIRGTIATLWSDPYEISELQPQRVAQHFASVNRADLPLFVGSSILGGCLLLLASFAENKKPLALTLAGLSLICLVTTGVYAIIWSCYIDAWQQAWSYLRFLFLVLIPLMGCAVVDSIRSSQLTIFRSSLALICALFFSITAVIQGFIYFKATETVKTSILSSNGTVLDLQDFWWSTIPPFNHWSTPSYAVLIQGRNPQKVVLPHAVVERARKSGEVILVPWEQPFRNGFFQLPDTRDSAPSKVGGGK